MNKYIKTILNFILLSGFCFSENRLTLGIDLDTPLVIQKASFKILDCLNTESPLGETIISSSGELVNKVGSNYERVVPKPIVITHEHQIIRPQNYVVTNFVGLSENVWTIQYVMVSTIGNQGILKKYVVLYKFGNEWRITGVGVDESDLVRFKTDYQSVPSK